MIDSAANAPPYQPDDAVRLPLVFDVLPLLAELDALPGATWLAHFNTGYHDGGWTGIALMAADGNGDSLYAASDGAAANAVRPTRFGEQCPQLLAAITQIQCRIKSARLLRLAPGSVIREHTDADLIWRSGEARLHIPLRTHDRVAFYVDGKRVVMHAGECWYLNLSRPHRVQNLGPTERVHLVLDCAVNDWLREHVQSGYASVPQCFPEDGAAQFSQFRDVVFNDPALLSALQNCTQLDELMLMAVTFGQQHGLHFSLEDVRAQASRGRREWVEQWIV